MWNIILFMCLSIIWNLFSCLGNFPHFISLGRKQNSFLSGLKWQMLVSSVFLLAKAQVCRPPYQSDISIPDFNSSASDERKRKINQSPLSFSLCYTHMSSMDLVVVAVLRYWGLRGTRTVQDLELISGGRNFYIRPILQWDFKYYSSKLSFMPSSQTTHNSRRDILWFQ